MAVPASSYVPDPAAIITGANPRASRNGARKFTAIIRSQSAPESTTSGATCAIPALLTRISIRGWAAECPGDESLATPGRRDVSQDGLAAIADAVGKRIQPGSGTAGGHDMSAGIGEDSCKFEADFGCGASDLRNPSGNGKSVAPAHGHSRLVWLTRISAADKPSTSRSSRIRSSKNSNWAASKSEPIGRNDEASDWSLAMVCAGMWIT